MSRVDRIVLGSAELPAADEPLLLLSEFVDSGGTRLDLANVYADGESSRLVGRWLARRATAPSLYVKGCHPPHCAPDLVRSEVDQARADLGVECLDRFILHRDDPLVSSAAWAESLQAEIERGAVASVGVSNWTLARFAELRVSFGEDADRVTVFSNHFSLAEMVVPTWPGTLSMTTAEAQRLSSKGVEVLAWASLAAGFFVGDDSESWDSDSNRLRRERAEEFAARRGVSVPAVALAYVLAQPAGMLAAVGTKSVPHLHDLLSAASIELEPGDLLWLEFGG